ncbi:MAG: hypothetical protein ACOC5E_00050, partial [Acidobacteriota bacterium]
MSDRLSRLESELRSLGDSLARLRRRVDALEETLGSPEVTVGRDREPRAAPEPAATREGAAATDAPTRPVAETSGEESTAREAARLIGGVLLVIAGGYLLRALTETGALP